MPMPKYKTSKRRSRNRRAAAYYNMKEVQLSVCPNCGEKKLPHRVCGACGYYNGKQVLSRVVDEG